MIYLQFFIDLYVIVHTVKSDVLLFNWLSWASRLTESKGFNLKLFSVLNNKTTSISGVIVSKIKTVPRIAYRKERLFNAAFYF